MKNKTMKKSLMIAAGVTLGLGVIVPSVAFAANDVAALAGTLQGNIKALKELAVSVAFMLGVVLFIAGLYLIYKDSKQPGQDHAKKGFISLLIGTALLLLPTMIGYASGTLGGADASTTSMKADASF